LSVAGCQLPVTEVHFLGTFAWHIAMLKNFEDLDAFQKAVDLSVAIYDAT